MTMPMRYTRWWPWLVVGSLGASVGLVAAQAEGEQGRHRPLPGPNGLTCNAGERMTPDGWCVPSKRPPRKATKPPPREEVPRKSRTPRGCPRGQHASAGQCCPNGEEWVPALRGCVGVGGSSPRSSGNRGRPQAPGEWVRIKAGSFTMGSPSNEPGRDDDERQHRVTITRDFWLQATEVTQGQWQEVMRNNPSRFKNCGNNCPVEAVNWYEAVAYVNALSKREGLQECYRTGGCSGTLGGGCTEWTKGRYCRGDYQCSDVQFVGLDCAGYRLPTEAEWEYAARSGTTDSRYGDLNAVAWHRDNSGSTTHRVGQKRASVWGLYDMLGNVLEWCHDWYGDDYPSGSVTDPTGSASGSLRVIRGGSWYTYARNTRAAFRYGLTPGTRLTRLGFRPSRSLP